MEDVIKKGLQTKVLVSKQRAATQSPRARRFAGNMIDAPHLTRLSHCSTLPRNEREMHIVPAKLPSSISTTEGRGS